LFKGNGDFVITFPMADIKDTGQSREPYHSYVHDLSERWPNLQHLDRFMSDQKKHSRNMSETHVTIIDITERAQIVSEFTSALDLSTFLDDSPQKGCSRLLLVEDISYDFIEYLGSQFEVDPAVFASHVYGFDWFGRCSSASTVPSLPSEMRLQHFAHLRYLEARPVHTKINGPVNVDGLPCFNCNILRKFSLMTLSSTRFPIGFARRHVTAWMKQHGKGYWTGAFVIYMKFDV
jgi:hypothetical protein